MPKMRCAQMWREAQEVVRRKAVRRFRVGVELKSDPAETRLAAHKLIAELSPLEISSKSQEEIELVFCEVINNVVEHAYAGATDGEIAVSISYSDRGMMFDVRDWGYEMPEGELPRGNLVNTAELPEGGFGWYLIRTLARDVRYRRRGDENRLTFRMPCEVSPPTA